VSAELRDVISQLGRSLAVLQVRVADDGDPDLGIPLARAHEIAPGWIDTYRELTIEQWGTAPPGMPSAFVLQYLVDPLATVISAAAMRTPFALSADPALWSIGLEPTYRYPVIAQVRAGDHRRIDDDVARMDVAYEGYRATASAIATALPSPTRMSSRQRLGMVEDMWEMALARLVGAPPPERLSCCLIYSLPGCEPCAGCPRQT
jgi:hypothetical protein